MRNGLLYAFVAVAILAAALRLSAQPPSVDRAPSKLTTALEALAGAVPQDDGGSRAQNVAPARLPMASMPKSVQDAVETRRLRLNDANEVQVYILMPAVTDDRIAQLTAAGVTIEIPDAARRRVQARIPASRLRA